MLKSVKIIQLFNLWQMYDERESPVTLIESVPLPRLPQGGEYFGFFPGDVASGNPVAATQKDPEDSSPVAVVGGLYRSVEPVGPVKALRS